MPPLWICLATSWLRSNVAILALLPASAVAFCAARATSPASVTTSVIDGSCCSLAPMVCCTDGRSVPLTLMFSVLGSVFFTPAHRASSWTCPCSWMTQSVWLFGVAWTIFCPTVWPARSSSEPKYIRAPYCLYWSKPALNATTGIPAVAGGRGRRADGVRGGQPGGDAVDLAVDRVLDQGRLLARVRVVGVLQRDVEVLGRGLGPVADLVPERVTGRLVRDHRDGVALAGAAAPVLSAPLAAAGRERGRADRHDGERAERSS